jgi:hypothetical protein
MCSTSYKGYIDRVGDLLRTYKVKLQVYTLYYGYVYAYIHR